MKQRHTYDYGVIGNCAYMAYVRKDGDINWMCWPRFDSTFVFGGMLDPDKGGQLSIKPCCSKTFDTKQYYIENTNVLVTEFEAESGSYRVTDFAPRFEQYERVYKPLMLIRKIEPISGMPRIKVSCQPVGAYGKDRPSVYQGSSHIRYLGLGEPIRLATNVSLSYVMDEDPFVLNETKYLILTYGVPLEASINYTAESFLVKTIAYWQNWIKSTSIGYFYQADIIRSALLLKIKQFEDTGAIVAAGTTSLPEHPGSTRNWDYRYCWMRDSYYTLNAFNHVGHFEELERYFHYIENTTITEKERFQPLYTITGQKKIEEWIVDLEGYPVGDNKPVRIGNDAYTHIQNDVYGQVIVALMPLYVDRRFHSNERVKKGNRLIMHALDMISKTMDEADAGLWEFRNRAQRHCYTFLFHWAGSCAAMRIAKAQKNERMFRIAEGLRVQAEKQIEACYRPEKGYYAQAIENDDFDASCLQLITMHYLDPNSEKAKKHLRVMEEALKAENGLFYRYRHQDDFGEVRSTFLICAFWYVEALAAVGRIDDAKDVYEKLSGFSNHLGLLSEDVDPHNGSQWGNFPQAYSHVGQMNAAYRIAKKLDLPNFFLQ